MQKTGGGHERAKQVGRETQSKEQLQNKQLPELGFLELSEITDQKTHTFGITCTWIYKENGHYSASLLCYW